MIKVCHSDSNIWTAEMRGVDVCENLVYLKRGPGCQAGDYSYWNSLDLPFSRFKFQGLLSLSKAMKL